MLIGRNEGAFAAAAGRIGSIEMRHDFAGAAVTGDPAKVVIAVFLAKAGIGGQRRQAVGGHAAGNRVWIWAVRVAGGQGLVTMQHAIGKLHAVAAGVAKAPMAAIAFDP